MLIDALESGKAEWAPAPTPPTMKAVLEVYEQQSAGMEKRWNALPADRWDRHDRVLRQPALRVVDCLGLPVRHHPPSRTADDLPEADGFHRAAGLWTDRGRTVRAQMFERYTESARRALFFARYEVSQLGATSIEAEHLLLGVSRAASGVVARVLSDAGLVHRDAAPRDCRESRRSRERISTSVEIPFSRVDAARAAFCGRGGGSPGARLHRGRAPAARRAAGGRPRGRADSSQSRREAGQGSHGDSRQCWPSRRPFRAPRRRPPDT